MQATQTLDPALDRARRMARNPEACLACGGQLAVITGECRIAGPNGTSVIEDSPRARRKNWLGCGACNSPAPLDHPRQLRMDAEWDEREARDAAETERARKAVPPKMTTYEECNPVQFVEGLIDRLTVRITALEKQAAEQSQTLHHLVNDLGAKLAALEHPPAKRK